MTVYKMMDVVGTSGTGVSDAVRGALERAHHEVEQVQWFEVKEIRGRVTDDGPEYQVKLQVGHVAPPGGMTDMAGTKGSESAKGRSRTTKTATTAAKGGAKTSRAGAKAAKGGAKTPRAGTKAAKGGAKTTRAGTKAAGTATRSRTGTPQTRSESAQVAARKGQKGRSDLAQGFEKQPGRRSSKTK